MITIRVAPGVTLHADTPLTATADPPPAAVAHLLRQLADDLDRQNTHCCPIDHGDPEDDE